MGFRMQRSWALSRAMNIAVRRYPLVSKAAALEGFAQDMVDYVAGKRPANDYMLDKLAAENYQQLVADLRSEASRLEMAVA